MLGSVSPAWFTDDQLAPLRAVWGYLVTTPTPGRLRVGPIDVTGALCPGYDMQQSVGLIYELLEESGGAGLLLARFAADDRVAALLFEIARGSRSARGRLEHLIGPGRFSDRDLEAVVEALRK